MQHRTSKLVEHYGNTDCEKTYYIHDAQGNVMAVNTENSVSSVVTTKQDAQARDTQLAQKPLKCSDRLGIVRRNLELGDQGECPYCPTGATIEPGMLRIVEVMYDSPMSNGSETHEGEFIVLRNATGITIPLESVQLAYTGGVKTFLSTEKLGPYQWMIVPRLTGGTQASFATLYGLTGYNTNHDVEWSWDNSLTLPDAGGTVRLFDYSDGVVNILDEVDFGGSGIVAANAAVCSTACSTAQTVQLDNFLTSPHGEFNSADWSADNVSGYGQQGMAAFVLDNTYERDLGGKEYAQARKMARKTQPPQLAQKPLKSLGNVRVVVSDIKHSDANSGTPTDFMADEQARDTQLVRSLEVMEMPGAVYQGDYRYGFNGMERDDEVKGEGMSYDFGARVYDPRVGRWWSVDAMERKYPGIGCYVFAGNMPIIAVDPDGYEMRIVIADEAYKEKFLAILLARTGTTFEIDGNGLLKVSGDQKAATSDRISNVLLHTILNAIGTEEIRSYTLVSNAVDKEKRGGTTLKGDILFDSYDSGDLDVADLEALGEVPEIQAAVLGHIVEERTATTNYDQGNGDYDAVHPIGIAKEVEILNEMVGPTTPYYSQSEVDADPDDGIRDQRHFENRFVNSKTDVEVQGFLYKERAYLFFQRSSAASKPIIYARSGKPEEIRKNDQPVKYVKMKSK